MYRSKFLTVLAIFMLYGSGAYAQYTLVHGIVTDARTNEPLPFVSVSFAGNNKGSISDEHGNYILRTENISELQIKVQYVGYKTVTKDIQPGKEQTINIVLSLEPRQLKEVAVKGKKKRYKNKDNPAVELINKVIEHKKQNRIESANYYSYEQYEKIIFGISNITDEYKRKKAFRKFQFAFENLDTTKLEGKPILPVYMKERISDVYHRSNPNKTKEILKGEEKVSFDGYLDDDGLSTFIKYLFQDINIYDNNVTVLTNQFLSPISNGAPVFYKYFILDTTIIDDQSCIRLGIAPRNLNDFLFQGYLFITNDSNYAVKKIDLTVSRNINLNWTKDLRIVQEFQRTENGKYLLAKDDFMADFGSSPKSKRGIFGQRSVSFKNVQHNVIIPDSIFEGSEYVTEENATKRDTLFWSQNRHEQLSASEQKIYTTIDSVKKVPVFKRTMDIANVLLQGYKTVGPYFEIGPVNTFYSFNPVEGFRLRFGGRTTNALSRRFMVENYLAYGFKDEKLKGYMGFTYSLSPKSIWEFPVRSILVSYQQDTKIPGQELQFIQEDNFLLSFKRGANDKWLYNDIANIEYLHEFQSHFSYAVGFKYWIQQAAGGMHYYPTTDLSGAEKDITTAEASLTLRWAPKEQFYIGKQFRFPVANKYPIFTIKGITGIKGFINSEYNYVNITGNIYKRFYLSQLGYTDAILEGGKIFGTVPYPLLSIARANQTYSYQLQSYNLMNFLEFVSDEYVSINIDHCFNGFFLNKIPLVKKLKFREYMSFKALYGDVSNNNRNTSNPDLLRLPVDANGQQATYTPNGVPYIEGSVGIGNVLKFFRIELVRRFTYLDHPGIAEYGIRGRFKFDF